MISDLLSENWASLMKAILRALAGLAIIAGFAISTAKAHMPLPEESLVQYTMEQAAKLTIAACDAAVDGVIETAQPITIERIGGCSWVTELRLRVLRPIWGELSDTTLLVLTQALPDGFSPSGNCSIASIPDELPAPDAGLRGIFLMLGDGDDWIQIVPGFPVLPRVRDYLLVKDADSVKVNPPGGTTCRWSYDEYVVALQTEAGTRTVPAMSKKASLILLATLGSYDSREINEDPEKPSWRYRFPLTIESVHRGPPLRGSAYLTLGTHANREGIDSSEPAVHAKLDGILSHEFRVIGPNRVLLFGNRSVNGDIVPLSGGLLAVDAEGNVRLPSRKITMGAIMHQWQPLSELEELLR